MDPALQSQHRHLAPALPATDGDAALSALLVLGVPSGALERIRAAQGACRGAGEDLARARASLSQSAAAGAAQVEGELRDALAFWGRAGAVCLQGGGGGGAAARGPGLPPRLPLPLLPPPPRVAL